LVETLQIDPARIVVMGDSAGAHLSLNLIRYLKESRALPMPGRLLLFSPWSDMAVASLERPNLETDYLRLDGLHYAPDIFLNTHLNCEPLPILSPYASSCNKRVEATKDLFEGFPKTLIHYVS